VYGGLEQNIPLLISITSAVLLAGGLCVLLLPPEKREYMPIGDDEAVPKSREFERESYLVY
jgi:hypothetical protein